MNIFDPKHNGKAKEIRHYLGSLFVFLVIMGIMVTLIQFPVLETNKEVVMMMIGTSSASENQYCGKYYNWKQAR